MQQEKEVAQNRNISDRRDVAIILSVVLFALNFIFFYFIWLSIFPEMTGALRVVVCWVGAYALTWFMTYVTKGVSRLVLTLIMLGVYYLIFHFRA